MVDGVVGGGGVFFGDYRVSPKFLVVLGLLLWLRLGLGCDNSDLKSQSQSTLLIPIFQSFNLNP